MRVSMDTLAFPPPTSEDARLEHISQALGAFRRGDSSIRLPDDWEGRAGDVASEFNALAAQSARMSVQLRDIAGDMSATPSTASERRLSVEALGGFWLDHA